MSASGDARAEARAAARRASIVVPTVGRRDSLLRLLGALERQDAPRGTFEVVVVLDGADTAARDALERYPAPFPLRLHAQARSGRAAACNAGAHLATGDLLVFLDDDMEPAPGFVAAHLDAHRRGDALGVVGAAPIVVDDDAPAVVAFRAAGFARKLARLERESSGLAFNDVYTGNFSIRRDVFTAAGGYDEGFRRYGHEDYEMVLRLQRRGVRFAYTPAALARQHYAKTLRALAVDVESEGRTAVVFAIKHPEALPSLGLSRYAARSRRTRRRLGALLALCRAFEGFPDLMVSRLERRERRAGAAADRERLFARFRTLFDVVYWLGVERELRGRGVAGRRVRFADVARLIAAARRAEGAEPELRSTGQGARSSNSA